MSFDAFKTRVNALIARAGGGLAASFSTDEGKHVAKISDGTTIIGNSKCLKVSVRWGSGHTAIAAI